MRGITKLLKDLVGDKSVLFVDDESMVLETMSAVFSFIFKKVYFASDGKEGLETFKSHSNDIDIVITDISMPHMDGLQMIDNILKIRDDIEFVCVTGHNEDRVLDRVGELKLNHITKPLNTQKLHTVLEKIYK
jgi:YesN/AraC family two-component response regulator